MAFLGWANLDSFRAQVCANAGVDTVNPQKGLVRNNHLGSISDIPANTPSKSKPKQPSRSLELPDRGIGEFVNHNTSPF